jgi:hypothetical protein
VSPFWKINNERINMNEKIPPVAGNIDKEKVIYGLLAIAVLIGVIGTVIGFSAGRSVARDKDKIVPFNPNVGAPPTQPKVVVVPPKVDDPPKA